VHTPPAIVLYGHDEQLLMGRARILEDAGFRTSIALDVKEIPQLVRKPPADLVILGNTLSRTECVVAGMVAKNHRAALRTLLIVPDGYVRERDWEMSEVVDDILRLSLEPAKLVAKVKAMVGDRSQNSLLVFPEEKVGLRRPPVRASFYPSNSRITGNRRDNLFPS
jgi:DNA-binding response OmpR family regulator